MISNSGPASCRRISSASTPPTRKKNSDVQKYIMPMRLWSTVVTQLQKPVSDFGLGSACQKDLETVVVAMTATPSPVIRKALRARRRAAHRDYFRQIGRASCRERVEIRGVGVS